MTTETSTTHPDTEADPEDTVDPDVPGRAATRSWAGPLVALALVAAVAGAVWTGVGVRAERDADARERAALAAGREAAVAFTSYDYRRIEEDLDRVSAMSTGKFREEFTKALGALTGAITKARGVSEGQVNQAGVVRMHRDSAVVIAAVDATITNKQAKGPSLRRYRLQITLTRDADEWLISDISPVA